MERLLRETKAVSTEIYMYIVSRKRSFREIGRKGGGKEGRRGGGEEGRREGRECVCEVTRRDGCDKKAKLYPIRDHSC